MSKTKKMKSLAEQIAELDNPQPIDFDPEANDAYDQNDDDADSDIESQDSADAREHYVKVGKSRLRGQDPVTLGPQYAGSRVGRDALDGDSDGEDFLEDDYEDTDEDDEQNGLGDQDSEDDSAGDEEPELSKSVGSEDSEEGSEDEDMEVDNDHAPVKERDAFDTAKLRALMNDEAKSVAASIGAAAKSDAEKGAAVKTQRKTFDNLLNVRMNLQGALKAVNQSAVRNDEQKEELVEGMDDALKAAETAALTLLNNLSDLQSQLIGAKTGSKRKRTPSFSPSSASAAIWESLNSESSSRQLNHDATLDRWSEKSRPTTVTGPRRLASDQAVQPLTSVLKSQLTDSERLIARTQVPRSCAPSVSAPTPKIYDDADFYGLLLKELLEQRNSEVNGGAPIQIELQAAREAKTKRVVDTRASKGRKLRYTVHEKLQNFMAPDDRGDWTDQQADEFFGGLLGRASRSQLDEQDDEIGGLTLF